MQAPNNIVSHNREDRDVAVTEPILDYAVLLDNYSIKYTTSGFYLKVGEPDKVQGWILHLSVIVAQVEELLREIIPVLFTEGLSFKIIRNRKTARTILDGGLGYEQLGKVICIYPSDDHTLITVAKKIIELTLGYKGPNIPTDIYLGGAVYTRYGGYTPIIIQQENGEQSNHIYDCTGNLIKDPYDIPFKLPKGIDWPFGELASPIIPREKKVFHNIYTPTSILKEDARGNVTRALYLKGLFHVIRCVVKEGKRHMVADDLGRDVQDRLMWQRELQEKIGDVVPFPKIYDLFLEKGNMYLVMELIKGQSLYDRVLEITGNYKTFFQLPFESQHTLLDYLLVIVTVIQKMHNKGYVHRDIAPGNFLVDGREQIIFIDTELAYHIFENTNLPPFELGTPGFMSPEQAQAAIPTVKEDIYGVGGLMLFIFATLSPVKFDTNDHDILLKNVSLFIQNEELANLIANCLKYEPESRPDLSDILSLLKKIKSDLGSVSSVAQNRILNRIPDIDNLYSIICKSLDGLSRPPMPISKGIWMSKTVKNEKQVGTDQKDYSAYAGLRIGMGGVLYFLARAYAMGLNISEARDGYKNGWKFMHEKYLPALSELGPGLYAGAAGIALALAKGLDAGLLENNKTTISHLQACLEMPTDEFSIAEGLAGQGVVLLQSRKYLDESLLQTYLAGVIDKLLRAQQKNGSWIKRPPGSRKKLEDSVSFAHGFSGIGWFLLDYYSSFPDQHVKEAAIKVLDRLETITNQLKSLFDLNYYARVLGNWQEMGDERTGLILTFLKAYEVLGDGRYKEMTEYALCQYPDFIVNNNFTQDGGLASLGELYLEAWRVFGDTRWQQRAYRVAEVFIHTVHESETKNYYWLTEEVMRPSCDLLIGNAGIIHFLMRCLDPVRTGYILLK